MNKGYRILASALLFTSSVCSFAQTEEKKPKDIPTMATDMADDLQRILKLDDYQTFLVDSTFQYNFTAMTAEMDNMKKSGVVSPDSYKAVSDRWLSASDSMFFRIFSEEQWARYLKTSYGREKKIRDRRMKSHSH